MEVGGLSDRRNVFILKLPMHLYSTNLLHAGTGPWYLFNGLPTIARITSDSHWELKEPLAVLKQHNEHSLADCLYGQELTR